MTTSNFDAEFGRAGGSVTTVVLKSGTNQFKGSVFAFANTESTQARSYFASATSMKPETKYQQFGATLGGPIIKDKLFFFTDYQRTVDNLGQLRRVVIPPAEWRNGDFSSASTNIYDPATGNADGTGRTPFPGNIIPANRLSPVAQNILAQIPQPNIPGAAFGQVNYELPSSEREKTTNAFNVKLNYNPTSSDQMSLRFSYQRPEIFVPGTFGELGGAGADFAGTGYQNTYSAALTWTRTLSQSLIMEWRAGYSKYHNEALSTGHGPRQLDRGGHPGRQLRRLLERHQPDHHRATASPTRWSASRPACPGTAARRPSASSGCSRRSPATTRSRSAPRSATTRTSCSRSRTRAACAASSASTAPGRRSRPTARPRTASPTPSRRSCSTSPSPDPARHQGHRPAGHQALGGLRLRPGQVAGDPEADRRPRPALGVLHAARRDRGPGRALELRPLEQHGRRSPATAASRRTSASRARGRTSPRGSGRRYRFNEKTVLRAGFGTTIVPFPDNRYAYNFPVKQTNQFNAPNSLRPGRERWRPASGRRPSSRSRTSGVVDASIPQLRNAQLFYVPARPEGGQAPLLERGLPAAAAVEPRRRGRLRGQRRAGHRPARLEHQRGHDARAPTTRAGPTTSSTAAPRTSARGFATDTSYNSLQAKLDRRFRNGFLVTTSYTLSRAINYSEETDIATPADIERSKGRADFDRTHVFASSFIWDMPFFKEDNGALHWILGGWQFSGIFTAYSGTPINFTASAATLARPGQHAAAERERRPGGLRRHRPGPDVLRHVGLLGAGAEHLGQHEAQRLDRRPRLLERRRSRS